MARLKDKDFVGPGVVLSSSKAYDESKEWMARPRSRRPQQLARWLVWGVLGAFLLALVLSSLLTFSNLRQNREIKQTLTTQYNPSYRVRFASLGAQAVRAFYEGAPSPMRLAPGLVWPGGDPLPQGALSALEGQGSEVSPADQVAPPASPSEEGSDENGEQQAPTTAERAVSDPNNPALKVTGVAFVSGDQVPTPGRAGQYQERLTYSAVVNGLPYRVQVAVGIADLEDYSLDPVLLSTPTLLPVPGAPAAVAGKEVTSEPSGYQSAKLPQATLEQLVSWAGAYAGDDRASLRQFARDDREDYTYLGLPGGWEYVPDSMTVDWSYRSPGDDGAAEAAVTFSIKVPDTEVPPDGTTAARTVTGPTQVQRMNVLIEDFQSGVPVISAYGPAGSYPDLSSRSSAVNVADAPEAPAAAAVTP